MAWSNDRLFEPYASGFPADGTFYVSLITDSTPEEKQMEKGKYRISAEVNVIATLGSGNVQLILPTGRTTIVKPDDFEFKLLAPAEPPHQAAIVDNDGDVWQRDDHADDSTGTERWYMTGRESPENWEYLSTNYGPVKVIHTP